MSNDLCHQRTVARLYGWHIYVISEEYGEYSKIGTASRVRYRVQGLQNGNPRRLIIERCWRVRSREDAFAIERHVLVGFGIKRVSNRDWLKETAVDVIQATNAAVIKLGISADEVEAE